MILSQRLKEIMKINEKNKGLVFVLRKPYKNWEEKTAGAQTCSKRDLLTSCLLILTLSNYLPN